MRVCIALNDSTEAVLSSNMVNVKNFILKSIHNGSSFAILKPDSARTALDLLGSSTVLS